MKEIFDYLRMFNHVVASDERIRLTALRKGV